MLLFTKVIVNPAFPSTRKTLTLAMMIKSIFSFCLLLPALVLGQNTPGTLLWEVSKPGSSHTSYLFGTFHEVNPTFFSTLPMAVRKLEQSTRLYVERTTEPTDGTTMPSQLTYWSRDQWETILNPAHEKVFAAFVTKAEDPMYYTLPPLLLTSTLARLYIQNFCDTLNRESVELMDQYIEKMGRRLDKQVLSLDKSHVEILKEGVKSQDSVQNANYVVAVVDLMDKMLNDDASDCEVVHEYINFQVDYRLDSPIDFTNDPYQLRNRNNAWMVTLNEAFQSTSCFVAVGFGHLRYKEGLIQQLRELGYTVKPLPVR